MKNISINVGFGFVEALSVAFIVLKLCGIITWPWFWVLSPIWLQLILGVIGLIAFVIAVSRIYEDF
ncbi:MAG: transmembrane Fragile-X-F protein [Lachnospiraceae bacterium]|nr:transmembrane Fragile-X-F protein [Lachnospiraceae bacterium]MBQ8947960.1 transmembrane Fragile-X-F protein [Lachnospiraceae bacterium]